MFSFFFKKNFYEGWDNVLFLCIPNLIMDAFGALTLGIFAFSAKLNAAESLSTPLCIAVWAVAVILLFVVAGVVYTAWGESACKIANYESTGVKDFFRSLPRAFFDGTLYGLFLLLISFATVVGLSYYFKLTPKQFPNGTWYIGPTEGSKVAFVDLAAGSVFAWMALTVFQALFFYPAVRASTQPKSFFDAIKKCFVILLDNLGSSASLAVHNIFLSVLSIVMAGLLPGFGGLGLARANYIVLICKKYDFIKQWNTEHKTQPLPKKLPWADILQEDIRTTGNRTLKTFFFPWKDK